MPQDQSDYSSILISSKEMEKKTVEITYPYVECNRLIFNQEWLKVNDKYESMNMPIPASEEVEKYIKLPFSLNCLMLFSFFKDEEMQDHTVLDFQEVEYLIDVPYETLRDKILAVYGITFK